METRFCGHKTGFNPTGENTCNPNELGSPKTTFGGRPAVPAGPLKRYPGAVADISSGNRRLSKATHGEGELSGTVFKGTSAFNGDVLRDADRGTVGPKRGRGGAYTKK